MSAYQIDREVNQVLKDGVIWDNKKFGYSPLYTNNLADTTLIEWRRWYTQYYDGCKEAEKKKEIIDW